MMKWYTGCKSAYRALPRDLNEVGHLVKMRNKGPTNWLVQQRKHGYVYSEEYH